MKIFTYGTLKKNYSNFRVIDNKIKPLIKNGETLNKYCLYQDQEPFPYLEDLNGFGKNIKGEIVELINKSDIDFIDYFEGVPDLYYRKEIDVKDSKNEIIKCWAYFKTDSSNIEDFDANELLSEWKEK